MFPHNGTAVLKGLSAIPMSSSNSIPISIPISIPNLNLNCISQSYPQPQHQVYAQPLAVTAVTTIWPGTCGWFRSNMKIRAVFTFENRVVRWRMKFWAYHPTLHARKFGLTTQHCTRQVGHRSSHDGKKKCRQIDPYSIRSSSS